MTTGTKSKHALTGCCGWAFKVMQNIKYNIHLKKMIIKETYELENLHLLNNDKDAFKTDR